MGDEGQLCGRHGSLQRTLLIVEDNPSDRAVMEAFAEALGFKTVSADDAATALALARVERFDAVVLDQLSPSLTGAELLRRIRGGNGPNVATPALLWTACDSTRVAADMRDVANVDVYAKPLPLKSFREWAERLGVRPDALV